jgi:hypothetical protein
MWRICNYVLILLATAGGVLAQPSPQPVEPKKPLLDFTFPRRGVSWWTALNNKKTYIMKQPSAQQGSTCSIPLLEAPIPKDTHYAIRTVRPDTDKMGPMRLVRPPAPSCAETSQ